MDDQVSPTHNGLNHLSQVEPPAARSGPEEAEEEQFQPTGSPGSDGSVSSANTHHELGKY